MVKRYVHRHGLEWSVRFTEPVYVAIELVKRLENGLHKDRQHVGHVEAVHHSKYAVKRHVYSRDTKRHILWNSHNCELYGRRQDLFIYR